MKRSNYTRLGNYTQNLAPEILKTLRNLYWRGPLAPSKYAVGLESIYAMWSDEFDVECRLYILRHETYETTNV